MKKSEVISVRIPSEVYDMLNIVANKRREKYENWLKQYGPIGCFEDNVTPASVAKQLLISAIGKEYAEVING